MGLANPRSWFALVLALGGATTARADVFASQVGGKLILTALPGGGSIRIEGTKTLGEVLIVLDPATIKTFVGVRDVIVRGGDGDDEVAVSGLQIGGSLKAKLGDGNDAVSIDTFGWVDDMPVVIGGGIDARMGGQSGDVFQAFGSGVLGITIHGNVTIKGAATIAFSGAGDHHGVEDGDCVIAGNLRIDRAAAKSAATTPIHVLLTDLSVGGATKITLGPTNDLVSFADSTFAGKFALAFGSGDDTCDFLMNDTNFDAPSVIDAGPGTDVIAGTFSIVFSIEPSFETFELKA